jgi:DNA-binding PadR family transcriptional regulator
MRRKAGSLIPIEVSILETGIDLRRRGRASFHGFLIAREIQEREAARLLTAHGTLYRALDRLQRLGFLESEWEDPLVAASENRPRRRFYRVTAAGEAALVRDSAAAPAPQPQRRLATS